MTHVVQLNAKVREVVGKSSKRLARDGMVPAVVYGPKFGAVSLALETKAVEHLVRDASIGSTLVDLKIDGRVKSVDVIVKEVIHDPIKGGFQHVDLWAVNMAETVQTVVSVAFVGTSEGERSGGVVMHSTHELHVEARPGDLTDHIEVDVSALGVGDSLTLGDLIAPEGVTFLGDPATVLVSVMPPTVGEEEAATEVGEVPEVGKEAVGSEGQ